MWRHLHSLLCANRKLASQLWEQVPEAASWAAAGELFALMLGEVQHPAEPVQRAAAAALAQLVRARVDARAGADSPAPDDDATPPQPPQPPLMTRAQVLRALQDVYSAKLPVSFTY